MHNGIWKTSSYDHLSHDHTLQHGSSHFSQSAPHRGNFGQGSDSVNNWSHLRDDRWRVSEEQTSFREGKRHQWATNRRGHWNRGGDLRHASQSQRQPYQTDSNNWNTEEPEVDEWGREIRGRHQPPSYDLQPIKREEALDDQTHVYSAAKKRKRSRSTELRNKPFMDEPCFERHSKLQGGEISPKRRIAERNWDGQKKPKSLYVPQHRKLSLSVSAASMPISSMAPFKGGYTRDQGSRTILPHEMPNRNHQNSSHATFAPPPKAITPGTPPNKYREVVSPNQDLSNQATGGESARISAQSISTLVNKFFGEDDGVQGLPISIPLANKRLSPTAPRFLSQRIESNFLSTQRQRHLPQKMVPMEGKDVESQGESPSASASPSFPIRAQPQTPYFIMLRPKEHSIQNDPNASSKHSGDVVSGATQMQTILVAAPPETVASHGPRDGQATNAENGDAFEFIGLVGAGSYGRVFKAREKQSGQLVALKKIKTDSQRGGFPVTALREIKILQSLHHENVAHLREMVTRKGAIFLNFEYLEHDLVGLLMQEVFELKPEHKKSLSQQLLKALAYIHSRGVLHRDLKPANLLVTRHGTLKLGDFGLARFYNKRKKLDYTNHVCTLLYRPPELMLGETIYGPELDIWSTGCIFMELFLKNPPFQAGHEIDQIRLIYSVLGSPNEAYAQDLMNKPWYNLMMPTKQSENCFRARYIGLLSEDALDFAESLLHLDGSKRPSAACALDHPYFTNSPVAINPDLSSLGDDFHEYECVTKKEKLRREQELQAK